MALVPYALTRPFLFGLDPEQAHELTLGALARVQHTLLVAQQTAVRKNTNVLFVLDYAQSRMRIVQDTNSNGAVDASEPWSSQKLSEGAKFAIPTTTVDGATAYYATGPGITTTASGRYLSGAWRRDSI